LPAPALVLLFAATLACATAALAPGTSAHSLAKEPRTPAPQAMPAAADDSSRVAHELLLLLRGVYGGVDNWGFMDGVRYYATFRIPGPDSTQVTEWTESHMVWLHDRPRVRIDNSNDSTVVVVTGDTTYVRRDGVWTTDPAVVDPARALALEASWMVRVPWNLLEWDVKRRVDPTYVKDGPLSVRLEYGPGQDRPAGTRAYLRFDPPTYALRQVRWYDPRAKGWYLMELTGDQQRYGWTWATRRLVHASDAEGKVGPVVLDMRVDDMQIDNRMPLGVLAPPNAVAVRAPSDTAAVR
jgi:hypothetical protein